MTDEPRKPHRPNYAAMNSALPSTGGEPTLAEQAKAFRAAHETARDERIAAYATALPDFDSPGKADELAKELVKRAQDAGVIRTEGSNGRADAQHMRTELGGMHGAAAFERYERQVTEAEIAKQMPRELRQAERLAQLQEQQQAAARSKEHGHENTHGSKR